MEGGEEEEREWERGSGGRLREKEKEHEEVRSNTATTQCYVITTQSVLRRDAWVQYMYMYTPHLSLVLVYNGHTIDFQNIISWSQRAGHQAAR